MRYIENCEDHCRVVPYGSEIILRYKEDSCAAYVRIVEFDSRSEDDFGAFMPMRCRSSHFEACPECGQEIEIVIIT